TPRRSPSSTRCSTPGRRTPTPTEPHPGRGRDTAHGGLGGRAHPVHDLCRALLAGAVGAAEPAVARLDAMPHDAAAAVLAHRRHARDGALEGVEGVHLPLRVDLEGHVIVVAAHFASGHVPPNRQAVRRGPYPEA